MYKIQLFQKQKNSNGSKKTVNVAWDKTPQGRHINFDFYSVEFSKPIAPIEALEI
jgi:hypothetical protein